MTRDENGFWWGDKVGRVSMPIPVRTGRVPVGGGYPFGDGSRVVFRDAAGAEIGGGRRWHIRRPTITEAVVVVGCPVPAGTAVVDLLFAPDHPFGFWNIPVRPA